MDDHALAVVGMHHGAGSLHSFAIKREPGSPTDKLNDTGIRRPPPNRLVTASVLLPRLTVVLKAVFTVATIYL